jgi:DNA-binding beta-propeller fold protein YncE
MIRRFALRRNCFTAWRERGRGASSSAALPDPFGVLGGTRMSTGAATAGSGSRGSRAQGAQATASIWRPSAVRRATAAAFILAAVGVWALLITAHALALSTTTSTASQETFNSATLSGEVNPEGVELKECVFQYIGEPRFTENSSSNLNPYQGGQSAPCEHPDAAEIGATATTVHAAIAGLTAGETYDYRLLAVDEASVTIAGATHTFTTNPVHTFSTTFGATASTPLDPVPLASPADVAVDQSTGDVYVSNPLANNRQTIVPGAGSYTLTFEGQTTAPIAPDARAPTVEATLEALSTVGARNVSVSYAGPNNEPPYSVEFRGALGASEQPQITSASSAVEIATTVPGSASADVEKFSPSGEFVLIFGRDVNRTEVAAGAPQAERDVCAAASGDECQPGAPGSAPGALDGLWADETASGGNLFLAVDNSPGGEGDVYVGDPGDDLVSKFDSSGRLIAGWAHEGQLSGVGVPGGRFGSIAPIEGIAVEPDGALVVSGTGLYFYEFSPTAAFLAGDDESGPQEGALATGIAVDAASNAYTVAQNGGLFGFALTFSPGALLHDGGEHAHQIAASNPTGLALDPSTRQLYATEGGERISRFPATCWESNCAPLDTFGAGHLQDAEGLAVDAATGAVYVTDTGAQRVAVFASAPYLPNATPSSATSLTATSATLAGAVDPAAAGPLLGCRIQYGPEPANERQTLTLGALGAADLTAGSREATRLSSSSGAFLPGEAIEGPGIAPGTEISAVRGRRLELSKPAEATATAVALSAKPTAGAFTLAFNGKKTEPIPYDASDEQLQEELAMIIGGVDAKVGGPPRGPYIVEFVNALADTDVPQLTANSVGLTPSGALVTVATVAEGQAGWPTATTAPCEPAGPYSETEPTAVTAQAPGLSYATTYRFRLIAENANGADTSFSETFTTLPHAPAVTATSAAKVYADAARIDAQINPGGGDTNYRVEYLTAEQLHQNEAEGAEEFASASQSPSLDAGSAKAPQSLTAELAGLTPDTAYRYRVIASNECEPEKQCAEAGETAAFTTLPNAIPANDACPNSHVRQQTSAAQLLDCRAYELVSAAHTAGYDVESNLIEGQTPYPGYPQATAPDGEPRLLYGVHDGAVPGLGEPTNRGVSPYVATRTPTGWRSEYVGLPSTLDPASPPFGSPLLAADQSLETFAFGGAGLCDPCFGEGLRTGVPLRLPGSEQPVQGMAPAAGITPPPDATDEGYVAAPLSADGAHLIFGSTAKFAEGGSENGEVSIYDHDLKTGETHVVSNAPGEGVLEPLACLQGAGKCDAAEGDANGISELAISADGSHVLLGQKVSEADGNAYWRLYMDIGDASHTIEVTPGATDGVLFAGMTEAGSEVFFTTADRLLPADTDHSADLYMWSQRGEEEGQLALLSSGEGSAGDTDSCNPVSGPDGPHWNTLESTPNCSVVAIGGGGLAARAGDVYFLSPEKLAGSPGAKNQPNLYLAAPAQTPRFIATLSPEDPLVLDSVAEPEARHTADFQLTPSGEFAAFTSTLPLAGKGEDTAERAEVYRYDAATEALACASCTLTETPSEGESSLASDGLSLTEDGRLFFNSDAPLVATDTDEVQDVYEWEPLGTGGCTESTPAYSKAAESCRALISAGSSSFPSALLSANSSGTDAYFFTRDKLAAEDENGSTVKVYDAREGGGFPYLFPPEGCKASDECHGPASSPPPPIEAGSEAGAPHNYAAEKQPKPVTCKKGYVKRHGHCVKRTHHKRHDHDHHHHERGGKG